MSGIFKAYDVRGIYGRDLTEEIARRVGRAFPVVLDESDRAHGGNRVVVSRDMRPSSVPLVEALIEGLTSAGLDVLDIGLATTPMNYFAIGHLRAAGGVQVTASHNPAEYNGLKFSRHEARPVSGDHGIPRIEEAVTTGTFPPAGAPGSVSSHDVAAAYREHVLSFLHKPSGARRLKVVVDAANGMAITDRAIFEALGVDLVPLYFELDGSFPNHEANPLKPENLRDLQAKVRETGADLGISCDGDFDRAAFVDETGEPVGSDLATALIAGELLAAEPGKHVLYDLRSSHAVARVHRRAGRHPGARARRPLVHEGDAAPGGRVVRRRARGPLLLPRQLLRRLRHPRDHRNPRAALALGQADVRSRRAAAPLRQVPGDQLRGRRQGRQDARARSRLRRRPDRLAGRHHGPVRRLVVQRPAVEHRTAAPARGRGAQRRDARTAAWPSSSAASAPRSPTEPKRKPEGRGSLPPFGGGAGNSAQVRPGRSFQ